MPVAMRVKFTGAAARFAIDLECITKTPWTATESHMSLKELEGEIRAAGFPAMNLTRDSLSLMHEDTLLYRPGDRTAPHL